MNNNGFVEKKRKFTKSTFLERQEMHFSSGVTEKRRQTHPIDLPGRHNHFC